LSKRVKLKLLSCRVSVLELLYYNKLIENIPSLSSLQAVDACSEEIETRKRQRLKATINDLR
jgi:hypothetical protein